MADTTRGGPWRARWWLVGGGGVLIGLSLLLNGFAAPQIKVRWSPRVSEAARGALEARFSLREDGRSERLFLYDLLDPSSANIRALVQAPEVEDTERILRGVFELREPVEYGSRRTGFLWRWHLEAWLPALAGAGVLVLMAGAVPIGAAVAGLRRLAAVGAVSLGNGLTAGRRRGSRVMPVLLSWSLRGVPVIGPTAFGVFRVAFAGMLGLFLARDWEGEIALDRQRVPAFGFMEWIQPWVAVPGVVEGLEWALAVGLVLLAVGLWSRAVYAALTVGFNLWFWVWALRAGTHPLGLLPLAMLVLLVVPWHEGIGLDRWRGDGASTARVPYGFAPWVLGMALSVAFVAAGYAKGMAWALNGTVRYHFMAESEIAMVPWGLWIAARPWLSVLVASTVVVVEHVAVVAMFWGPRARLAMGLVVAGLIAGFGVFHLALWPAWWTMLLGFVPWEWANRFDADWKAGRAAPVGALPFAATAGVLLLAGQQVVVSARGIEMGPYFSAYDMYSATFRSPEEFERANGGPRFHVMAEVDGREVDVGDCVRADRPTIAELEAAARSEAPGDTPVALARVVNCAARVSASRVRVLADQRSFDWVRGATGFRFRNRVLGDWRVP